MSSESIAEPATPARRILLVTEDRGSVLRLGLLSSGYETSTIGIDSIESRISEFHPEAVIFELPEQPDDNREQRIIAIAAGLRAESTQSDLPLLFCYHRRAAALRDNLLSIGADDYFGAESSSSELLARLESLFWRIEAGRRQTRPSFDRKLEIDNFISLLDSVREDIELKTTGAIALLHVVPVSSGDPAQERAARAKTLAKAHEFLKQNLRRADSITFYGPTELLIYMPGMSADRARSTFTLLRTDFLAHADSGNIAIGVSSFPGNGEEIEELVEKAESAVEAALRGAGDFILTFDQADHGVGPVVPEATAPSAPEASEQPTPPVSLPKQNSASASATGSAEPRPQRDEEIEISLESMEAESVYDDDLPVESDDTLYEDIPLLTIESLFERKTEPAAFEESSPPSEPVDSGRTESAEEIVARDGSRGVAQTQTPANQNPPETEGELEVTAETRRSFVSQGIDAESIRDLSMSEIMQKVTSVRSRPEVAEQPVEDTKSEFTNREKELRAAGTPMPSHLFLVLSESRRMANLNSLVREAGYDVRAAFNGRQALDLLKIERPDVIIIDYKLAGMDGIETIRRLRQQNGGRLRIPVLMLIPEDEEDARNEARSLGVFRVINSGYEPDNLLTEIRMAGTPR